MFLSLVFTGVLLHVTCVASTGCPTLAKMGPCKCEDGIRGVDVFCKGNLQGEIRVALETVASTKQRIFRMTLQDVWLPNLPPNFLLGLDVLGITVRNCSTSSVDEDAFADMAAKLEHLLLTHNFLDRVPSHALKKCFNLKHLILNNNRIEILHAEAFLGLDSLRSLSLRENRIKFIDNSAFVGIETQLGILFLGGNELTAVPYQPLRNLRSLTHLDLDSNKIVSLLPEELNALCGESSMHLYLSENKIRHLPASVFRSLERQQRLYLSRNGNDSTHASAVEGTEGFHCDCHLSWMKGQESSWFVKNPETSKCVIPEKYANDSLAEIEIDELFYDHVTAPDSCCNCFSSTRENISSGTQESISSSTQESIPSSNQESVSSITQESVSSITQESVSSITQESVSSSTQESVSISVLIPILQLSFAYLLNTVLTKWLF